MRLQYRRVMICGRSQPRQLDAAQGIAIDHLSQEPRAVRIKPAVSKAISPDPLLCLRQRGSSRGNSPEVQHYVQFRGTDRCKVRRLEALASTGIGLASPESCGPNEEVLTINHLEWIRA